MAVRCWPFAALKRTCRILVDESTPPERQNKSETSSDGQKLRFHDVIQGDQFLVEAVQSTASSLLYYSDTSKKYMYFDGFLPNKI